MQGYVGPRTLPGHHAGDALAHRWSGALLLPDEGYLAFDTETEVLEGEQHIPRPALASVSAGDDKNTLLHPDDLAAFVQKHRSLRWVCHNAAFDFWVVQQHLRLRNEQQALNVWWQIAEENRLHDSMILDMLLRLAESNDEPVPRNLAVIAREYAGIEVNKEDPYRLRYGEILGRDWSEIEAGFFAYALRDAVATRKSYLAIRQRAMARFNEFRRTGKDIRADARQQFGLLTEAIQVKKAIALAQIARNGMYLDHERLLQAEQGLRHELNQAIAALRIECPDLYKTDGQGNLTQTRTTQTPQKNSRVLQEKLQDILNEMQQHDPTVSISRTGKKGDLRTSQEVWQPYRHRYPFLQQWLRVEEVSKLLQFFTGLQGQVVHPRYTLLKRTGRTSCSRPNIQQIPRDGNLRECFIASPGHFLLTVDYSFIELRTLAAHLQHRYGKSQMAEVIRQGIDPHAHTAALMKGVSLEEFLGWKTSDEVVDGIPRKTRFKQLRQAAKAINFGVPGSMGAAGLSEYARTSFGVALTKEDAEAWRQKLIAEVYPELEDYLAADAAGVLAPSLQAPVASLRRALGEIHLNCIRKILQGDPRKADGKPYNSRFVRKVWDILATHNRNPDLTDLLRNRRASDELARRLCDASVATLTGRIRAGVAYGAERNTPFQGLAADGASLALFRLIREGYRVIAFIHDEILVELPDEGGYVGESKIKDAEHILTEEMAKVLHGDIPVACESVLSTCWTKQAEHRISEGKVYPRQPKLE